MTHDLSCSELVRLMHLIVDLFETEIGLENMSDTVTMLFRVLQHFWIGCV